MSDVIKQMYDEDGNRAFPVTHVSAVKDSNGTTLPDILDRDYPTTSKTPVEGSTEVSLVTRGEKFDYDKVNNATDVTGASDIANLKYVLFNGTNEQFKTALDSYVNERIRNSFGALLHNLDKSGTASGNIDVACVAKTPASGNTPESYDFGSMSAANFASLLGVNQRVKIIKGYIDTNTSMDMGLRNVECGFLWVDAGTSPVYKIPYWTGFETVISNTLKIKRATAGGDVTITTGNAWFTYMAFITVGNNV